jgi:hypothetical protein
MSHITHNTQTNFIRKLLNNIFSTMGPCLFLRDHLSYGKTCWTISPVGHSNEHTLDNVSHT